MEYTELTFTVPKGYEQQVIDLVNRKLDAIVAQIRLKPSAADLTAFNQETAALRLENQNKNKDKGGPQV